MSGDHEDVEYRDEDWYGEDLGDQVFERCLFVGVDLTEVTTRGARFTECRFHNCRLNASQHVSSAFVACEFRRSNLFDATFDDCRMSGSTFSDCTLRPIIIRGGTWAGTSLRGVDWSGRDLTGLDLAGADLSMADLTGAVLRDVRLSGAIVRETRLDDADLRGARLDGVDLREAILGHTRVDLNGALHLAEITGADVDTSWL